MMEILHLQVHLKLLEGVIMIQSVLHLEVSYLFLSINACIQVHSICHMVYINSFPFIFVETD
jgi:hypothetical protein